MAIPIVFIHHCPEIPPYLQCALIQARVTNPDSPIYCVTSSQKRPTTTVDSIDSSITFVSLVDYIAGAAEFEEIFFNLSVNPGHFERLCFQRWYILRDFARQLGSTPFFTLDSDVLLYGNVTEAHRAFADCDFTISSHYTLGCSFINNPEVLPRYCDMTTQLFERSNHLWGLVADRLNLTKPRAKVGNLSDMTTAWLLAEHGGFRWKDTSEILNGTMFDQNIILGSEEFEMERGRKKITWINRLPHVRHLSSGQFVRFYCFHFQGESKPLMPEYLNTFGRVLRGEDPSALAVV